MSEVRLIDAEALKKDIAENSITLEGAWAIEVECAKALIDNAPAVKTTLDIWEKIVDYEHCDTVFVEQHGKRYRFIKEKKGKWIRTRSLGNGNAHYTCSNCSYGDEHAESQEVPYCWHCGADMRGDV